MLFDSAMLARICAELAAQLAGCRIRRAIATGKNEVALETTAPGKAKWLVLCADPEFARVHLCAEAQPRPDIHSPLADVLRRYVAGAAVEQVTQSDFDRRMSVSFINAQGLGPDSTCTLVAEIMGRRSNILLLDEQDIILECVKHIPAAINRYRESLPGVEYQPPPSFGKLDPLTLAPSDLRTQAAAADPECDFAGWFRATFHGASELFVAEVAAGAGLAPDVQLAALAAGWEVQLHGALGELSELVTTPGEAYVCRDNLTDTLFAYPFVPQSRPHLVTTPADTLSMALDRVHRELTEGRHIAQLREQFQRAAGKQLEHILLRRRKRQAALAAVSDAERYRRWGELILAHLHTIPPHADQVAVTDYYSEDQSEVTIPLDPNRTPQEVAQHYFARYKRARRRRERLPRLIRVDRVHQQYLEGLLHQIEAAQELADLEELRQEMIQQDLLRPPKRPQPRPAERRLPRFVTGEGYTVLYGRTGRQNDEVLREGGPDDIWFHVKYGPGGHVVVRSGGRPDDVPESTILEAAQHAAALSKQEQSPAVDVNYTLVKHLNKPKGGPPGFVYYREFKTVRVAPQRANCGETD